MKESFWGITLIAIGVMGIGIIALFQNVTVTNEQDYYNLKEITEASMYDAVDVGYYRTYGQFKIIKEKFLESFAERFSESALKSGKYTISIYDVNELPPKVSIAVNTGDISTVLDFGVDDMKTSNQIDGILETKY